MTLEKSEYVKKWASYFAKCRVNLASSGKLKESRSEWRVDFLKEKRRKASRAEWEETTWKKTQMLQPLLTKTSLFFFLIWTHFNVWN